MPRQCATVTIDSVDLVELKDHINKYVDPLIKRDQLRLSPVKPISYLSCLTRVALRAILQEAQHVQPSKQVFTHAVLREVVRASKAVRFRNPKGRPRRS